MTTKTESAKGEAAAVGDVDTLHILEAIYKAIRYDFSDNEICALAADRARKAVLPYLRQASPAQGGVGDVERVQARKEKIAQRLMEYDQKLGVENDRWTWPEHRDDDGYRGDGGYVTMPPSDVLWRYRERADIAYKAAMHTTDAPDMGDSLDRKAEGCASAGITSPTTPPTPAVQGLVKLLNNEIQVCANLEGMQNQDASIKVTPKEQHCNYALLAERIMRLITPSLNAAPLPPMTAWQPIDTAPKDGTEILVVCEVGFDVAQWNVYCDHEDGWFNASGEHAWKPTHWMPLPAEPLPAKATGEV